MAKSEKIPMSNDIITLDIETTSLVRADGGEWESFDKKKHGKCEWETSSIMYAWGSYWNEKYTTGRTMTDLRDYLMSINTFYQKKGLKCSVWVHNLGFEFQFLRNIFSDFVVFARKNRKPLKAETGSMMFRCSLMLTMDSLASASYKYCPDLQKLTGQLDYTLPRHSRTPLTPDEWEYLRVDNLIVKKIVEKHLEIYEEMKKIPLTGTGKLRFELKTNQYQKNDKTRIVKATSTDLSVFVALTKCFQGGYTHANAIHTGKIVDNVKSVDIVSSYPTDMLVERFPMSPFKPCRVPLDKINTDPNKKHFLYLRFYKIVARGNNTFISYSKCEKVDVATTIFDNGRVERTDLLEIYVTDVDYHIIKNNYIWEKVEVLEVQESTADFLPLSLCRYIVYLFHVKQFLKKKDPDEYAKAKANLNSLYGMLVTNTVRDEIIFDENEWKKSREITAEEAQKTLNDGNKSYKTSGSYAWGVWVTAYARRKLWYLISKIGDDVVYCDTDSIKYVGDYADIIDNYNDKIADKRYLASRRIGVEFESLGNIGEFEAEKTADRFVTLGAKRYCYEIKGELYITVSGVPKEGAKSLEKIENFKEGFLWGYGDTPKLATYYHDEQKDITLTDYLGERHTESQRYTTALIPDTYLLTPNDDYRLFYQSAQQKQSNRASFLEDDGATDLINKILGGF